MSHFLRLVRPVDGSWMRTTNLSVVLAAIVDHGGVSRATLARETGLNKATVSSLAEELGELGWVRAGGQDQGALGRPSELLEPNPGRGVIIGTEINVDYLAVLVSDPAGAQRALVIEELDVATTSPEDAIERLAALVRAGLEQAAVAPADVLGLGLGVPGVVDVDRRLLVAANLGWRSVDVDDMLRRAVHGFLDEDLPVLIENEANLGAVAEQTYGIGARFEDFVYLSGELGVGAGVVTAGELLRGTHGAAGEVGHITVDPAGARCHCGKYGCWQVFVSQGAVLDRFREASGSRDGARPGPRPEDILAAAETGDDAAVETLATLDRYLAIGVGNLVEMYDPNAVVLGGFYSTMYRERVDELRTEVASWVMDAFGRELSIELSTHGQDACIWGATGGMLRSLIANPRHAAALDGLRA
jgi:predicted NBD/HSP70 family sugar kinase